MASDSDIRRDQVPDATAPPRSDLFDLVLGGEASVPVGEYGPPISSTFPSSHRRQLEVRDLERLIRRGLGPLLPGTRQLQSSAIMRAYRAVAMRRRSTTFDAYGCDVALRARARVWLEPLYRRYFRVVTEGIDSVPSQGPVVLVANHSGVLPYDVLMLMEALRLDHPARRDLRPLVEDSLALAPFLGVALARIGTVRACRENADQLLAEGNAIAIFPEGDEGTSKRFSQRYQLRRFGRGGFAAVALRAGATIVPVAIVGADESMPLVAASRGLGRFFGLPTMPLTPTFPLLGPLGLLPLPSRWRIHFGTARRLERGDERDRRRIKDLASEVRAEVERLLADALEARGPAFSRSTT